MFEYVPQGGRIRRPRQIPKPWVVLGIVSEKFGSIGEVDRVVAKNRAPMVNDYVSYFCRITMHPWSQPKY